jgi:hypothetical protein
MLILEGCRTRSWSGVMNFLEVHSALFILVQSFTIAN